MGEGLVLATDVPRLLERVADRTLEREIADEEIANGISVDSFVDCAVQAALDEDVARSVAEEYLQWRKPVVLVDKIALLEKKLWLAYDAFAEHESEMFNLQTKVQAGEHAMRYSLTLNSKHHIFIEFRNQFGNYQNEFHLMLYEETVRGHRPRRSLRQVLKGVEKLAAEPSHTVRHAEMRGAYMEGHYNDIPIGEYFIDTFRQSSDHDKREHLRPALNNLIPALRTIYLQNIQATEEF